jgi:hypothetical protein
MTTVRDAQSKPATLLDVLDHFHLELQAIELEPAENEFQSGYECAIRDLMAEFLSWYRANPTLYPGGCECPDCKPNGISEVLSRNVTRVVA